MTRASSVLCFAAMAHQEETDLALVRQFFAKRGLLAERIPETTEKTSDFKILRGSTTVAFCEVKSPQDVFPDRVNNAILRGSAGVVQSDSLSRQYRCMERSAKKAAEQFRAANASHAVPNILMIVNHDTTSREADFREAVTGYVDGLGYAEKAVRDEVPEIDAYVWLNGCQSKPTMYWRQDIFRDIVVDLLKA